MKRTSRKPSKLSELLQRHLNAYALAASAAGVGMLALAQPADARVIYTRADREVDPNHHIYLDLNHDGVHDFEFEFTAHYYTSSEVGDLTVSPARAKAGIWTVESKGQLCAAALSSGIQIGAKGPFRNHGLAMQQWSWGEGGGFSYCPWFNQSEAYLGLRFAIDGQTHYGWARFSTTAGKFLTGYAYETIPKKPIIAGETKGSDVITLEPGSLGRLAQGSSRRSGK